MSGEHMELNAASAPHARPLSPEYRGEGRILSQALLLAGLILCSISTIAFSADHIAISKDGKCFVYAESGKPFVPWGFNYDRDYKMRLIEDYWTDEWDTVAADFRTMKKLGANVVRIHPQFGKFMDAADKPNTAALDRLEKLLTLSEELGLYLDITGLGCYRLKDEPAWYAGMEEKDRWAAQTVYWQAIAKRCAGRAGVLDFDLINEPVVGSKLKPGQWVHKTDLGGFHYLQFIALDNNGREGAEVWRQWTQMLVDAIHKEDPKRLVTIGLLPLVNKDMLKGVSAEVDYMSVHLYPKSGKLEQDLATLKHYAVGKPLIIEETFPMECTIPEMVEFIDKSKPLACGWISFYWGQPLDELKKSDKLGDRIQSAWLEQFQKLAPTVRGE